MSGGMFPSCHPHMGPGLHLQETNGGQEVETHTKEQAQGEWNPLLCYLCHQVHHCNLHCISIYIYNNDTSDLPRPLPAGLLPHVLCQLSQRTEFGWQAVMSHLRVSPSQSGDIEIL